MRSDPLQPAARTSDSQVLSEPTTGIYSTPEDWSRLLDYLEVNAPADVDDVIAVLEVRAHRAEKRAADPALRESTEQWAELFHAHRRGEDLTPIFDRHIQNASDSIKRALAATRLSSLQVRPSTSVVTGPTGKAS